LHTKWSRHSGGIAERVRERKERDVGPRGISLERGRGRCQKHVSVMWEKGRTDAGWVREIGDDDVGGGVRGDRVCLFVAWCEGGVEWQAWR